MSHAQSNADSRVANDVASTPTTVHTGIPAPIHATRAPWRAAYRWILIPALLMVPCFIWIARDTSAWGGDQSTYGVGTLDLVYTLTHAPGEWPRRLLEVFPSKPNGLVWLGQLFVPFAHITGSLDSAMMLTIGVAQLVALMLMYRALTIVSHGRHAIACLGALVIAGAPLFIDLGQSYAVESIQTLSVAWFILLMLLAPRLSRPFLFVQLVIATAFALTTKASQPLFCVWPGLIATWHLVRPRRPRDGTGPVRSFRLGMLISLVLGAPLIVATVAWYYRNIEAVRMHVRAATSGPGVTTFWGKDDTYLNTIWYWIDTVRTGFFEFHLGEFSALLLLVALVVWVRRRHRQPADWSMWAAACALQLITIILVFSSTPSRMTHYLLPALPYVAMLVCWAVAQLNNRMVTSLAVGVFAAQFLALHGQSLAITARVSDWGRPLETHAHNAAVLRSIVARTCVQSPHGPTLNILAIDPANPRIASDWLAPIPANFVVAKNRFWTGGELPCSYGYVGDSFFGVPVQAAWNSMLSKGTQYFITADPSIYPPPVRAFNEALSQETFPELMNLVQTSGVFQPERALAEDAGILIFRRRDRLQ